MFTATPTPTARPSRSPIRLETAIEVEHLQKRYGGRLALSDVSCSVAKGEIFGILGPDGAEKTTTVEILQGLRRRGIAPADLRVEQPTLEDADMQLTGRLPKEGIECPPP